MSNSDYDVNFSRDSIEYICSLQNDTWETLKSLDSSYFNENCKVPINVNAFLSIHTLQKKVTSSEKITESLQNHPPSQSPSQLSCFNSSVMSEDIVMSEEPDDNDEISIFPMLLASWNLEFKGKRFSTQRLLMLLDNCSDNNFITERALASLPLNSFLSKETVRLLLVTLAGKEPLICDRVVLCYQIGEGGAWLRTSFLVVEEISTREPLACIHLKNKMIPLRQHHRSHHLAQMGNANHFGWVPGKRVDVLLKSSTTQLLLSQPVLNLYPGYPKMVYYKDPSGGTNNVLSGGLSVQECDCKAEKSLWSTAHVDGQTSSFKVQVSPKDALATLPPELKGDASKLESRLLELFRAENLDRDYNLDNSITLESRVFLDAMEKTFRYDETEKRYEIGLPWLTNTAPKLYNNYSIALSRFKSTENRLMVNLKKGKLTPDDINKVNRSVLEHIESGVYRKIPDQEKAKDPDEICFFLPLRLVYNYESVSTPVRCTMDASCESGSQERGFGPSLNDCIAPGTSSLPDQRACHLAFRRHRFTLGLDLSRYFLSVGVTLENRRYQRFVFREFGTEQEISCYEITSVAWGVSCSPQVCSYVLKKHCRLLMERPRQSAAMVRACEALIDNFTIYADNIQISIDDIPNVREMVHYWEKIFRLGNFRSGKYCSNDPRGLIDLPPEKLSQENTVLFASNDGTQRNMTAQCKLLGEVYNYKTDCYYFGIQFDELYEKYKHIEAISKRHLASAMATVSFSHLQFRGPFVLKAKQLLAKVCQEEAAEIAALPMGAEKPSVSKLWGRDLSKEILLEFREWIHELPKLRDLSLPRHMPCLERPQAPYDFTVVTFCDAGQISCCSVTYIISYDGESKRISSFCQARLRTKPIAMQRMSEKKPYTVPRLEFVALHMGVELTLEVCQILNVDPKKRAYVFSDSTIALAWAKSDLRKLAIWHNRRARDIQQAEIPLRYVYSEINPSDHGTKILPVATLQKPLWRHGPTFLTEKSVDKWPIFDPGLRKLDRKSPEFLDGLNVGSVELAFFTSQVANSKDAKAMPKYPDPKELALLKWLHLKTSMFFRAQRRLAYYLLGIQKLRNSPKLFRPKRHWKKRKQPKNTAAEKTDFTITTAYKDARILWYFWHQSICFGEEQQTLLKQLKQGVPENEGRVGEKSRLYRFNPQLKFVGTRKLPVIYLMGRISGREGGKVALDGGHLSFRDLNKDNIAQRTVKDLARQLHVGKMSKAHMSRGALEKALSDQGVLILRQKFFVRHITAGCCKCSRFRSQRIHQQMSELPKAISDPIVNSAHQLECLRHLMIDFAGPLRVSKGSAFQRRVTRKHADQGVIQVYVLLVVDIVSSYLAAYVTPSVSAADTATALASHIAIFLTPRRVYLDNASGFRLLSDELKTYYDDELAQHRLRDEFSHIHPPIQFSFGKPLHAAGQGKIERHVGLVKEGLRKIHQKELFSLHGLNLALQDVCGVINQTPLALTTEVRDAESVNEQLITPKSLVFGEFDAPEDLYTALESLPKKTSVKEAWEFRKSLAERFSKHYIDGVLPQREKRQKWESATPNLRQLKIGSIVLFDKAPSETDRELANLGSLGGVKLRQYFAGWPLGVIQHFLHGADGRKRGAVLRLPDGRVEYSIKPDGKKVRKLVKSPTLLSRSLNSLRSIPAYHHWSEFDASLKPLPTKSAKPKNPTKRSHGMQLRSSSFFTTGPTGSSEEVLGYVSEVSENLYLNQKLNPDYLGERNFHPIMFPFTNQSNR